MNRIRLGAIGTLTWLLAGVTTHAVAAPRGAFDIPALPLDQALRKLGDDAGIELLFDRAVVAGLRSRAIHGERTPDRALGDMLNGAPLTYRRTATGAYVIVAAPRPARQAPRVGTDTETAISEILITGRSTQNVDIRRGVNDIQPYKVLSAGQIADAQADDVEDLLRQHLSANAVLSVLKQGPIANIASSRSQVNLHGLGVDQTLILVDGRRMPATPSYQAFGQPDLNGLPLLAIDRIETLSATAGGIYGPGATGGVVNIVLKRDYSGGEIETGGGITGRGDAPQWRFSAATGHAWFDERLSLFAAVGYDHEGGLTFADRDYAQKAQIVRYSSGLGIAPVSNSWNVVGDDGFLSSAPLSVNLGTAAGLAAVSANTGRADLSLSNDGQGLMQSLLTRSSITSAVVSGRLKFSDRLQLFLDVLALQNTGKATGPRLDTSEGIWVAGLSPSGGGAFVTFPTPGWSAEYINRSRTIRGSLGLIARLGRGWSVELDASSGQASIRSVQPARVALYELAAEAGIDPAAGWSTVQAKLAPYADLPASVASSIDRFADIGLRAGGAVASTPAGPITLTLMAEARRDRLPMTARSDLPASTGDPELLRKGQAVSSATPAQREDQIVYSTYLEARAPLLRREVSPWLLRGLELQLALRGDRYTYKIPLFTLLPETVTSQAKTASTTVGFRAWPLDGVMVRASYATGYVPPKLSDMRPQSYRVRTTLADPKRGGEQVGGGAAWYEYFDGSPNIRPERATSLTVGAVLEPGWLPALRVTFDYTHLVKSDEVTHYLDGQMAYVVAHEDGLPGRVIRAPLTEADRAKGFTSGIVTGIDTSAINMGRSVANTVELSVDHRLSTRLGVFQSTAQVTWVPNFRRKTSPERSSFDVVGALDGPIALRGVFGVQWSRGQWSSGLSAQAFDGYRIVYSDPDYAYQTWHWSAENQLLNGRSKIPPQVYFDGDVSFRPRAVADREVVYRFAVRNLFDQRPPAAYIYLRPDVSSQEVSGYSTLSDPRGRRFLASVTARF